VSENSSMDGVGGMHSAPDFFVQEGGGSSLGLKTNSPVYLDKHLISLSPIPVHYSQTFSPCADDDSYTLSYWQNRKVHNK